MALRTIFIASAVPMIGFGFMDNLVMIQAGQYIDTTLGVRLGLATLTAAAMGQVISDVAGVIFGGTVERCLQQLRIIPNISSLSMSPAQRQLPITRNTALAGAVVGVIVGCCLGACTLFFMDLEARDRYEHTITLRNVVHDILTCPSTTRNSTNSSNGLMSHTFSNLSCRTCTVYIVQHADRYDLRKLSMHDTHFNTTIRPVSEASSTSSISIHECIQQRDVILGRTELDNMHDPNNNTQTRFCKLYIPIVHNNFVLAVLELDRHGETTQVIPSSTTESKHESENVTVLHSSFTDDDQNAARLLGHHLSVFMNHLLN
jgi:hypothetical protein